MGLVRDAMRVYSGPSNIICLVVIEFRIFALELGSLGGPCCWLICSKVSHLSYEAEVRDGIF